MSVNQSAVSLIAESCYRKCVKKDGGKLIKAPKSALFAALAALVLLASQPVAAADLDALAVQAEGGDVQAQVALGMELLNAGGEENFKQARKWLEMAARTGDPMAQNNYARLLLYGKGGPVDIAGALHWYEKAVAQNFPAAQYNLAFALEKGNQFKQDLPRAIALYKAAATHPPFNLPQFRLGEIYRTGKGVARDTVEAANWYRQAAMRGHAESQYRLATMVEDGSAGANDPREALLYYSMAMHAGHKLAGVHAKRLSKTAELPVNADLVPILHSRDPALTEDLLKYAVTLLHGTKTVDQDVAQAQIVLRIAVAKGGPTVPFVQGVFAQFGDPTVQDIRRAEHFFITAAGNGIAAADYNLGLIYYHGRLGAPDYPKALALFQKASKGFVQRATLMVAHMTAEGQGTDRNIRKAIDLYRTLTLPPSLANTPGLESPPTVINVVADYKMRKLQLDLEEQLPDTNKSKEGFFFREDGASNPLHIPASTLVGEVSAQLQFCHYSDLLGPFKSTVLDYIDKAQTERAKTELQNRIKAAYEKHATAFQRYASLSVCPDRTATQTAIEDVTRLLRYDWGFEDKPTDRAEIVTLGRYDFYIGDLRKQKGFGLPGPLPYPDLPPTYLDFKK